MCLKICNYPAYVMMVPIGLLLYAANLDAELASKALSLRREGIVLIVLMQPVNSHNARSYLKRDSCVEMIERDNSCGHMFPHDAGK